MTKAVRKRAGVVRGGGTCKVGAGGMELGREAAWGRKGLIAVVFRREMGEAERDLVRAQGEWGLRRRLGRRWGEVQEAEERLIEARGEIWRRFAGGWRRA